MIALPYYISNHAAAFLCKRVVFVAVTQIVNSSKEAPNSGGIGICATWGVVIVVEAELADIAFRNGIGSI